MARRLNLFAGVIAAILGAGCSNAPRVAASGGSHAIKETASSEAAQSMPYEIDAVWETDTGRSIQLSDLRGKPRILAMFFTSCEGTCLVTVESLKRIEASLSSRQLSQVGFVLITLDPAHDTDRALAAFRHANALSADRWTLLRGSPEATTILAHTLGVTFSRESTRGLVHSNGLTVTDQFGRSVHQQFGLHPDLAKVVAAVKTAADGATEELDEEFE